MARVALHQKSKLNCENMQRQIIALGGGGFQMNPKNSSIDTYILECAANEIPKICFLPTASGDSQLRIEEFYQNFKPKKCHPSHLSLFRGHVSDIHSFLLEQDIIYVGGGNTRNMMLLWKEWAVDRAIHDAYLQGTLLCGVSAGAICWFEEGLSDSVPQTLTKVEGMGLLDGSICPHFDGEPERQPKYQQLIQDQEMKAGIATDDYCALHYINEKLHKVVAETEDAHAYAFYCEDGNLKSDILKAELLTNSEIQEQEEHSYKAV